jgi:prenyltransferase beta subunit
MLLVLEFSDIETTRSQLRIQHQVRARMLVLKRGGLGTYSSDARADILHTIYSVAALSLQSAASLST